MIEIQNMQCPNCSAQMHLMQRHDIDIDFWPSCNQVWLDRVEIDKLGRIQSSPIETSFHMHYHATKDENGRLS